MFEKFTYRQKLKALPVAFLIGMLLIYGLAIKETLRLHSGCTELRNQAAMAGDAPKQLAGLRSKLDEMNNLTGNSAQHEITDPLLEFISNANESKSIRLVDYQPVHVFQSRQYQIVTRIAVFAGNFDGLLRFLWRFEKDYKKGIAVSVDYKTDTNLKTGINRLLMTMYIQSIKDQTDSLTQNEDVNNIKQ